MSALNFSDKDQKLYKTILASIFTYNWQGYFAFPRYLLASIFNGCKNTFAFRVFGHGWILSDKKKMSKSLGNILDPIEIINKYGIDQLMYYLIKEVSLGNDGNISLENLENCINNDLANNYGNLCQRVFTFLEKNCNNKIPLAKDFHNDDKKLNFDLENNLNNLIKFIDKQDLNDYIKKVIEFSFDANKYFNDQEPWKEKK